MESFKPFIAKIATGARLSADEARQSFDAMLSGEVTPAQMGGFLMALRVRGELAWHSNTGGHRRKAMKALNAETAEVLSQVNSRLIALQGAGSPELDA